MPGNWFGKSFQTFDARYTKVLIQNLVLGEGIWRRFLAALQVLLE